jgi:hypothetical protein
MVTVLDGHPHTLAFLGTVNGVATTSLGVGTFGQAGSLDEVTTASTPTPSSAPPSTSSPVNPPKAPNRNYSQLRLQSYGPSKLPKSTFAPSFSMAPRPHPIVSAGSPDMRKQGAAVFAT